MKSSLRKLATSVVLITLVALAARLAFAAYQSRQISARVLSIVPFQTEAGHIAYSIATGKGYSSPFQRDSGPTAWLAPVYPILLAGIFRIFGTYTIAAYYAALSLNIFCSAAACIPVFCAGKRVAGIGVASTAAWLWALFPNAILIPVEWIWDTSLSALLAAVILWATLGVWSSARLRDWCAYGLLWGVALLTNPALGELFPVLLFWAGYRAYNADKGRFFAPLAAAAVALLCCVPWTVRNYVQFHQLIPLRSNFAFELYVGNNENYDEQHRLRPGAITQDREILRYLRMGEPAFMEEEKRKAWAFIEANPRIEMRLIWLRFIEFWVGTPTPFATFHETDSFSLRLLLLCNYLVPFGALLGGVVLTVKKNAFTHPLIAFPLVFPLLYYITHTSLRYRHPIDPVVLLLCGIGLHGILRWVRRNPGGAKDETYSQSA